jgi:hypothetical protein
MKIIKKGKPKKVRMLTWWIGMKVICQECKTVAILEKGDIILPTYMVDPATFGSKINQPIIKAFCPVCSSAMFVTKKS